MNSTSFFIPPFQRAYSWGSTERERFFNDVVKVIESELNESEKDKLEHFFGTIVLKEESKGFAQTSVIIDGQQRLTTALLLLIALRDLSSDPEFKNRIDNLYLKNNNSDYEDKIKLKQVTRDWEAYKAIVKNSEPPPGLISSGYKEFRQLISRALQDNKGISFDHFITAFQRLNIAVIFLDERPHKGEDPQIIFETLNSLGKDLTLADLVRNFVLLPLTSERQTYIFDETWHPKIENVLDINTSPFYRDYLQFKIAKPVKVVRDEGRDSNTKEVYQLFKDYVENQFPDRDAFIRDIVPFAKYYKWIVSENITDAISKDNDADKEIKELLRNIFHDIKAEPFKPFVLGLLKYHQDGDTRCRLSDKILTDILKSIRTYLVRRRILGLTQGENKSIVTLVPRIEDLCNGKTTMFDILASQYYKLRLPNDREIEEHLENADFYNGLKKYAKFILGKIEEARSKVSVDFRNSAVTIEHIMPQKLSPSWKTELGKNHKEIHDKYLHNIGNLILTEFNYEIGNKPFVRKKEEILKSNLSYRLDVKGKRTWNEKSILAHRQNMIKRLLETFPLPEKLRFENNWNQSEQPEIETVSPCDDSFGEIAEGTKPVKVIIEDREINVSSWQDVFLKFLLTVERDGYGDFETIIENQYKLFKKTDVFVRWKSFQLWIQEKPELGRRYKTLDGKFFDDESVDLSDDLLFVHINSSAEQIGRRIAALIDLIGLRKDVVQIELGRRSVN